ncbi:MAG TPA: S8 family peptidase [Roseiflexaceae bacterium]|nr:S8 family peptidase [Roseiflexaceae bacterium]
MSTTDQRINSHAITRRQPRIARKLLLLAILVFALLSQLCLPASARQPAAPPRLFIVQAASSDEAAAATARAAGRVSRRLGIIHGVSAWLNTAALQTIAGDPAIRAVYPDRAVYPTLDSSSIAAQKQNLEPIEAPSVALNAVSLHHQNILGNRVTVAVVDTGLAPLGAANWVRNADASIMLAGKQPADGFIVFRDFVDPTGVDSIDPNGHGTHVAGSIVNNRKLRTTEDAMGVAPGANLVVARALDANGAGSYTTVIAAIDWVVQQRSTYGIKVLNLSLYAPVASPYWADPLAQAVMRAWQAGLVVVVAAGNDGPNAATITVPANVPYVITVGALKSGQFTRSGGDELASFSARGPTESAFAKPDILVPAVRVVAPMPDDSVLATQMLAGRLIEKGRLDVRLAQSKKDVGYYQLSGTSMAAAEASGVVALLLQAQPGLTNDQVKYRLKATARLAIDQATGRASYSIWEQGAGNLQTAAAVTGSTTEPSNQNLDLTTDLNLDLATHPWGETTYDAATGTFHFPTIATTPPGYMEWIGAGRTVIGPPSWTGDPTVWSDASRVWRGASRVWRGADMNWTGDEELWAGASRVWRGALQPTLASRASVDPERLDPQRENTVFLPGIRK